MRRSILSLAGALLAGSSGAAAQASAPAPAQPARWHVDGASNRCILTRRLEGTPVPATLILRTVPGSGRYDVILGGRDLPSELRRHERAGILKVIPGRHEYAGETRAIDLPGELDRGVLFGPLPAAFATDFASAGTLSLADGGGTALGSWTVPTSRRAAEALAYCEAEKQVEWGADPASVEPGATPARPIADTSHWLTPRDLGVTSAGTAASSAFAAVFRLVVGPDGRATACTKLESASNIEMPGDPCKTLVRRARFEPARSAAGKTVTSVAIYVVSMRTEVQFRD
jgi:protein TonB